MARYTGPKCRLCRQAGLKLYLKGEKCYTDKCPVARRPYPPGMHGQGRHRSSEYGRQLREKNKARNFYMVLERQFTRYVDEAERRQGVSGETLLQLLESRLDTVLWRLGIAASKAQARQMIHHNHITVNGRKVNIPSFLVRPGDTVSVREKSRSLGIFDVEAITARPVAPWLERQEDHLGGRFLRQPARDEIDTPVQESMIIEYYSR